MNMIIINKYTREFVPYKIGEKGEIIITSSRPQDNDETCIVTTWDEITKKNLERREIWQRKNKTS
jgi:phosphorylcholine metabolism protein LicD